MQRPGGSADPGGGGRRVALDIAGPAALDIGGQVAGHERDAEGVGEFCRRVRPRLLGALVLQFGHAVAEELTQETLLRIYLHWERVRTLHSPQAWAFHVAYNLGRSQRRRRRTERLARGRDLVTEVVFDGTLERAQAAALRDAITLLPPKQRAALILRYYADLPVAEVAGILRCAPSTVKTNTRDALLALRRLLAAPPGEGHGT